MTKIGLVSICHIDYDVETANCLAKNLADSLRSKKIDVYHITKPVIDAVEAVGAGRDLVLAEVDGVIIMLGTWIECPVAMAVLREVEHLPLCLYAYPVYHNGSSSVSTGSFVSYTMFKGSLERAGYQYKGLLGLPDDKAVLDGMVSFAAAASCLKSLRRSRIGLVGYSSMTIYPGTFDHLLLRTRIGPEVEHIDSYTLISLAESFSESDCESVVKEFFGRASIQDDVTGLDLVRCARLYLSLQNLVSEKKLHAINVKCQYEFSKQYKMVMCVPLSLLAETGVVASCEGDMLNTVSMVILHLLSENVVTYGDFLGNSGAVIKVSTCGFAPYSLGMEGTCKIRKFMPHSGFCGIQNCFPLKPGVVTVMRLVEDVGSYHMIYSVGRGLESQPRDGYMPNIDIELDSDMDHFIKNCSGQHFALCYGDQSSKIEDLASLLKIRTIRL